MEENITRIGNGKSCIYDVRSFGAEGNGATKDTAAIQRAIDTCHLAGAERLF